MRSLWMRLALDWASYSLYLVRVRINLCSGVVAGSLNPPKRSRAAMRADAASMAAESHGPASLLYEPQNSCKCADNSCGYLSVDECLMR